MDVARYFEIREGYAVFRPPGDVSLEQAVALVTSAILLARNQDIPRLLVMATEWRGISPEVVDRFWFASEWAQASAGAVKLAMVVPAGLIHPDKFGVTVAGNRGLLADAFSSEADALHWLQAEAR